MKALPPATVSLTTFLTPAFALVWGAWINGERFTTVTVLGMAVDLAGRLWVDTTAVGLHRLKDWDAQGRARFERISERLGAEGVFGGNLHEDGAEGGRS